MEIYKWMIMVRKLYIISPMDCILKIAVQDRAFKEDDCYNFYAHREEPPDHARLLNAIQVFRGSCV